jgi:hypothetical protein
LERSFVSESIQHPKREKPKHPNPKKTKNPEPRKTESVFNPKYPIEDNPILNEKPRRPITR